MKASIACLAALALAATAVAAERDECGLCHPQQRVEFARSIHAGEQVACADCHGGDPGTRQVEAAHGRGFRSLAERRQVPALCAECHADLERMRPFNLPVDQYAVYQTSQHGRALVRGVLDTAVCTDCHGVHDIRAGDQPGSRVAPRALPDTCGQCHAAPELMKRFDLSAEVVARFRAGLHGQALLVAGNLAAPSCASCHGTHGPAPPGYSDVDKVCGACHPEARRFFRSGPHYPAMAEAGMPECVSCHSSHEVIRLDSVSLEQICAECHGQASDEARLGSRFRVLIEAAAAEIESAEELLVQGSEAALDVEDHASRIEEARTQLREVGALVHTVSLEPVELMSRRARSIGEEVEREIYEKLDRRPLRLGLVVFWFYVLLTLTVLVLHRRKLGRDAPPG